MSISNEELKGYCDDLDQTDEVSLSDKEADFLNNCMTILEAGKNLSSPQESWLKDLWDRHFG